MTTKVYVGNELDIFAHARNWKQYFARRIRPHITGSVLEVGAGLGETTLFLCGSSHPEWVCLEPDVSFCERIEAKIRDGLLPRFCRVLNETTESLSQSGMTFQTILYIDVLEHIEDDTKELLRAERLLTRNGRVIVLAPAHNFLFTPFDSKIGHYRRYDKATLLRICPPGLIIQHMEYLDSVGMLASLANRVLLRQGTPRLNQVKFWDNILVRASQLADPLFFHRFGRSIIAILSKRIDN